jgi:hypothetical protein
MKATLILTAILLLLITGCEKCKDCYLIEVQGSVETETFVGERCDQQIEELENHDLVCLSDDCYYKCR